jgi:hypothetical protein
MGNIPFLRVRVGSGSITSRDCPDDGFGVGSTRENHTLRSCTEILSAIQESIVSFRGAGSLILTRCWNSRSDRF